MKKQKFRRGDLVHISKDMPPEMDHFPKDQDAIVIGSYADQFGGNNHDSYTVLRLKTGGETSWYYDHQLTFVRRILLGWLDWRDLLRLPKRRKETN